MEGTQKDQIEMADSSAGDAILRWSWRITAGFVVMLGLGVMAPNSLGLAAAAVSLMLFALGSITFLWAYVVALQRSRTDDVSVAGLYLLSEGAPKRVRQHLLGALGVQSVCAIAAASVRPFTALAFGLLAPIFGLGMNGMWAARHGQFRPRMPTPPRRRSGPVATRTKTTPPEDARIGENPQGDADAR